MNLVRCVERSDSLFSATAFQVIVGGTFVLGVAALASSALLGWVAGGLIGFFRS